MTSGLGSTHAPWFPAPVVRLAALPTFEQVRVTEDAGVRAIPRDEILGEIEDASGRGEYIVNQRPEGIDAVQCGSLADGEA